MTTRTATINELVGLTLTSAEKVRYEELVFRTDTGRVFRFFHEQDCCETVSIEDICGDLNDLVGSPILKAEESKNKEAPADSVRHDSQDYWTWTFYHFATLKGYVTVRWYGTSNGYYSESVDFEEILDGAKP